MTLSFDPQDTYIDMVMKLSDEKLVQFFDSMGIEINLDSDPEDDGVVYDCEA